MECGLGGSFLRVEHPHLLVLLLHLQEALHLSNLLLLSHCELFDHGLMFYSLFLELLLKPCNLVLLLINNLHD